MKIRENVHLSQISTELSAIRLLAARTETTISIYIYPANRVSSSSTPENGSLEKKMLPLLKIKNKEKTILPG
jgi:hypothetical protein